MDIRPKLENKNLSLKLRFVESTPDPMVVLPHQDVLQSVHLHLPLLVLRLQPVEHLREGVAL
jgi:hypothetical protein